YVDLPSVGLPPTPENLQRESERINKRFDIELQFQEAEQFAQEVLRLYRLPIDVKKAQEQFKKLCDAVQQKHPNPAQFVPKLQTLLQNFRDPSPKDGIPHNVKRRVDYARSLMHHIQEVRENLEKGEVHRAIYHSFWVGRYYEASRVCEVEHIAVTGRGVR